MSAFTIFLLASVSYTCVSIDITYPVFGHNTEGQPAAFGDFDSDELTDMFVLKDQGRSIEIMFGSNVELFLKPGIQTKCKFNKHQITSVVPGDFNGDALMDLLQTNKHDNDLDVHILWGRLNVLTCPNENKPLFTIIDKPLIINYDNNMVVDLFGVKRMSDGTTQRMFWLFNSTGNFIEMAMKKYESDEIRIPQLHGFVDIGGGYKVWLCDSEVNAFIFNQTISFPDNLKVKNVGQTAFMDLQLKGRMDHIVPVCFDTQCINSTIYFYDSTCWYNLYIHVYNGNSVWGFVPPMRNVPYLETITVCPGDFNMDGYHDLLCTLCLGGNLKITKVILMENVACTTNYLLQATNGNNNNIMRAFYDFFQNGILDVLLFSGGNGEYNMSAFKSSLDYDANFLKVMVVSGFTYSQYEMLPNRLGKKSSTFGANLPGPKVSYLPQFAYYSLYLPYTIFGLGRTSNFIDELTVSILNETRSWTQIIPNSQIVIIINSINDSSRWNAKLFLTPSRLIFRSAAALAGTCLLILVTIGVLQFKELQEDRIEKRKEAHKFNFAM
ncbi:hypothetical protein QTP88_017287 [Uroleucon formosanum]